MVGNTTCLNQLHWWPSIGAEAWFEVPGKLPLFRLSTLHYIAKETRFIDLTLCNANWSLVNTCIGPLWSIWTGLLHECHINWQDWQDIELGQVVIFLQNGKICSMLCSFLPWTGTGNMIPGSDKIPGSRSSISNQESSWHKVCGVCQSPAFSAFNIAKETVFIDLNSGEDGDCEDNGFRTVVTGWHLHACPSLQYWWSIWTGLQRERHINWQDWQDIELAQVLVFFWHGKSCSMLCSFLLWTGTGNMIPGRDRIPGSLNTAASATKESSQHKIWGVCQAQAFSAFNIATGDTLHWSGLLTRMETVKRMVLSQSSLANTCRPFFLFWWLIWTGLLHERSSICKTGKTLN